MAELVDEKMHAGMKAVYVSSLERILQYEQELRKLNPPEVIGYKSSLGRRVLSRAIFGLYEELCSMGERLEADELMIRYRPTQVLSGKRMAA